MVSNKAGTGTPISAASAAFVGFTVTRPRVPCSLV